MCEYQGSSSNNWIALATKPKRKTHVNHFNKTRKRRRRMDELNLCSYFTVSAVVLLDDVFCPLCLTFSSRYPFYFCLFWILLFVLMVIRSAILYSTFFVWLLHSIAAGIDSNFFWCVFLFLLIFFVFFTSYSFYIRA